MPFTCGSLGKTKIWKDAIGIEYNMKKKFCVLQEKALSFGPNCTLEVWPNNSAKLNFQSVTTLHKRRETKCLLSSYLLWFPTKWYLTAFFSSSFFRCQWSDCNYGNSSLTCIKCTILLLYIKSEANLLPKI